MARRNGGRWKDCRPRIWTLEKRNGAETVVQIACAAAQRQHIAFTEQSELEDADERRISSGKRRNLRMLDHLDHAECSAGFPADSHAAGLDRKYGGVSGPPTDLEICIPDRISRLCQSKEIKIHLLCDTHGCAARRDADLRDLAFKFRPYHIVAVTSDQREKEDHQIEIKNVIHEPSHIQVRSARLPITGLEFL